MKKATLVFIEDDESIEMKIDFNGEEYTAESSAHLAAASAYKFINDLLSAASEGEGDAGQQ